MMGDQLRQLFTALPASRTISASTPSPGAGSSIITLSVSMSIRFWSLLHRLADLDVPAQQGGLGHRLGQLRDFDFDIAWVSSRR
jgi:hypothetical protein